MNPKNDQTTVPAVLIVALMLLAGFCLIGCFAHKYLEIQLPYPSADIGSWGFIDKQGKYVIEPRFNSGGSFKNGFATVCYGKGDFCNHSITIDKQGKEVTSTTATGFTPRQPFSKQLPNGNTEYVSCREFSEGVAVETVDTRKARAAQIQGRQTGYILEEVDEPVIRLISASGATIKELVGKPVRDKFSEGLLPMKINNLVGYIDTRGELVIKNQFDNGFDFHDGLACVIQRSNLGQLCGYIDKTGKLVIPYAYPNPKDFHDGRALVEVAQGKEGYIDKTGKMLIAANSGSRYNDFSEGIATFSGRNKSGLIDKTGKIICSLAYHRIGSFSDGLCAARTAAGVGFIDKTGKWVLPPKYRFASDFSEGLAAVCEFDDQKLKQQEADVEAFKEKESNRNPGDVASFDYVHVEGHRN